MKRFFILLLILIPGKVLFSQDVPRWLRYPSISPDGKTIVFTYKGDVYKVATSGGAAVPLTTDTAHDFMPVWSHDGRYIAFASNRSGNFDIFIMQADGGEEKRITFHSADEYPYDFSADNKHILFGSVRMDAAGNRQFPSDGMPELYQVPVNGGRVEQVLTTPAEDAKVSKDGQYIIYHDKKGRENAWRKHQVSAIARDIWRYNSRNGQHTKLTAFKGEDRNPVFADNDKGIYYLSEESGSFNVHHLLPDNPTHSQQITTFKKHPVRFLSIAADGTLCFSFDGELYVKAPESAPRKVRVRIAAGKQGNDIKTVPVADDIKTMVVSPTGKELAFIFRGEVFAGSMESGAIKRITETPGEEADLSFSPDGRYLLYASERNNGWQICRMERVHKEESSFFAATQLKETVLISNDKENYQPLYSGDGKEIAYLENRTTLRIYNIASRQSRTIIAPGQLFSRSDHDQYFQWSPDGKWLLVQYNPEGAGNQEVGIISTDGNGKLINLTESGFNDEHPQWAIGGQAMLWSSDRNGLRSFSNSGSRQRDVYAMFFSQSAWEHFKPAGTDTASLNEQDGKGSEDFKIAWEGLRDRTLKLTTSPSLLAGMLLSKAGKTLYHLTKAEKNYNLWVTDLRTKDTKILLTVPADDYTMQWDSTQQQLFLCAGARVWQVDPAGTKQHSVTVKGEMSVNLAAERNSMFQHVWRRTKEAFYTKGYHGADWDGYKRDYEKYLPHIGNNYEFAEMLSELLGELNVSHSGATSNDKMPGKDVTASLGLFYNNTYRGAGVKIEEIIRNGPLDVAAFQLRPGMIIEAIDGEKIMPDKDLPQYLNHKAGKRTVLTIRDGNNSRDIVVEPVSPEEENNLLYKRWVARNREEVEKESNGQLGYVHLYRMNDAAYRDAYGEVMGRYFNRKGMVVDTRFNRGGDLASDLNMFLSGREIRRNTTDNYQEGIEPGFRWTKPSVVIANEANYSDGHCFVFDYQYLHMGKLIGMPVPGSCTFMTGETLQDNSMHWSVPSLGVKSMEGYYLENHETEPDIRVMNTFEKVSKGEDQQLAEAVKQLLQENGAGKH
ncbi:S41 family peptidase [Chitinophaga sp. MM2321]|uniref:S41 family peptidase n=1 Tax=Chitinophaga sp. MM2321 TaxID=3137178 RepID=UPI0032D59191